MPAWLYWMPGSSVKIVHYGHDAHRLFGLCVQLNIDGSISCPDLIPFGKDYIPIKGAPIIIIEEAWQQNNIGR